MVQVPTVEQVRQLIRDVAALEDTEVVAFGLSHAFGSPSDPPPPPPTLVAGRTYVDFGSVGEALTYRVTCVLQAARPQLDRPFRIGEVTRWVDARIEGHAYVRDLPTLREAIALARVPATMLPTLGSVVCYRHLEGPCGFAEGKFRINQEPVEFWRFMVESGRLSADPLLRETKP